MLVAALHHKGKKEKIFLCVIKKKLCMSQYNANSAVFTTNVLFIHCKYISCESY